jgi:phosphohistidine phosphatase
MLTNRTKLEIYVMRHGEAVKNIHSGTSVSDADRPLTISGKKEIEEISYFLKALNIKFSLIISSPLQRAHQTAFIVSKIFKAANNLEDWDELKPEGAKQALADKLSKLKEDSAILLVGHEPFLSSFMSEIVFGSPGGNLALKKGGFAKLRIMSNFPKMTGELRWLLTPRLMRRS